MRILLRTPEVTQAEVVAAVLGEATTTIITTTVQA